MNWSSVPMGESIMKMLATTAIALALVASAATAQVTTTPATPSVTPSTTPVMPAGQAQILTTIPGEALTVTHWYKQNVYDPGDNKIGEIMDVLVDKEGKINAMIIGVGGFLGIGEKDVAVPF